MLELQWHKSISIEGDPTRNPMETSGVLRLGADYLYIEETGKPTSLFDFSLRRAFSFKKGESTFENYDLFVFIDMFDLESANRVNMGKIAESFSQHKDMPSLKQSLFEATLHVHAPNMPPLKPNVSDLGDDVVVRLQDQDVFSAHFGKKPLTEAEGEMLAKALRYAFPIHPAALDTMLPLRHLPERLTTLSESGADIDHTTIWFDSARVISAGYPLPDGLNPDLTVTTSRLSAKAVSDLNELIKTGVLAAEGRYEVRAKTIDDYFADASHSYDAGDKLDAGLTWLAAAEQYPDKVDTCRGSDAASFCTSYNEQLRAATRDSQFQRVVEASMRCEDHKFETGAKTLADVDVTREPHGYVAYMLMFCLLAGTPPDQARMIDGIGSRYPGAPLANALRAIQANPYIPSYYYDIGVVFAKGYQPEIAWRLFDLGRALGGGRPGDAFDLGLKQRQQYLLTSYPGFF